MQDIKELQDKIAELQIKADKYDALEDMVSTFYVDDEGEEVEDERDLGDLGEVVAIAFGYL